MAKKNNSAAKHIARIVGIVVGLIGLIVFFASTYTLDERYTAIVLNLGRIESVNSNPGFHFKAPFVSISKIKFLPSDNFLSTYAFCVTYLLPENSAHSKNSSLSMFCWNFSLVRKK